MTFLLLFVRRNMCVNPFLRTLDCSKFTLDRYEPRQLSGLSAGPTDLANRVQYPLEAKSSQS